MFKKTLIVALFILMVFQCSDNMFDNEENRNDNEIFDRAVIVSSESSLPICNKNSEGQLFYIIEVDEFRLCDGANYQIIYLNGANGATGDDGADGADGADGVNGISIIWISGAYPDPPVVCEPENINIAYYDSDDFKTFICDGSTWQILAQDGLAGAEGTPGADGADGEDSLTAVDNGDGTVSVSGTSITWAKCPMDDSMTSTTLYNSGSNDCSGGSGSIGSIQYCATADNACNGIFYDDGLVDSNSDLFNECAGMSLGGRSWRVPLLNELAGFFWNIYYPFMHLFPNADPDYYWNYWTANSCQFTAAYKIDFFNGLISGTPKNFGMGLLCVSDD
jgi:hypothetical protein